MNKRMSDGRLADLLADKHKRADVDEVVQALKAEREHIAELKAQIEMHSALSEHRAEKIDRIYEILGQVKNDGWTGTQYALASRILKVLEQADE